MANKTKLEIRTPLDGYVAMAIDILCQPIQQTKGVVEASKKEVEDSKAFLDSQFAKRLLDLLGADI